MESKLPTKPANRLEMDTFYRIVASLDSMLKGEEDLKARAHLIPGGWRDLRACAALMDKLEGGVPFPVRLNNTEQGLFLEGYYHQMRDKFRRIEEAKQNKENSEEA